MNELLFNLSQDTIRTNNLLSRTLEHWESLAALERYGCAAHLYILKGEVSNVEESPPPQQMGSSAIHSFPRRRASPMSLTTQQQLVSVVPLAPPAHRPKKSQGY